MTDSAVFNPEVIGGNGFYWWIGEVVDDKVWKTNELRSKWKESGQLPGWGSRYKVRIVGRHADTNSSLSDNYLEMCEVMLPVTGGSGHALSYQSPNIRKGTIVIGFFKDGRDANEPIIIGCLANNDQTPLKYKQGQSGFEPFSGLSGETVPVYGIPAEGSGGKATNNSKPIEGGTASSSNRTNIADQQQKKAGKKKSSAAKVSACGGNDAKGIQLALQKAIQKIQDVNSKLKSWQSSVSNLQGDIQRILREAAEDVSKFFKNIINGIREFVLEQTVDRLKEFHDYLFPNERDDLLKATKKAVNSISCIFNKIISNLINMLISLLEKLIDRFINVPLCAVENIIASILGKIFGLISGLVDSALGPINAILGTAISLGEEIFGTLRQILSFISCDEKSSCPEIDQWSIWDGAGNNGGNITVDINSIFNKAKSIGLSVKNAANLDNFNFNMDFSDIFQDTCNVGPVFCGPPKVEFYGGGGSGASGNVIVSAIGDIIGVDIITPGQGYTNPPFISFKDDCGKGDGATGYVRINDDGTVSDVVITDPGTDYLPAPDGSLGGDDREWARPDQAIVFRSDGTYDTPYDLGETVELNPGDEIYVPRDSIGASGIILDEDNQEIGTISIPPGEKIVANNKSTVTISTQNSPISPRNLDNYPTSSEGVYPVVLYLCEVVVQNSGINYSKNDKITVTPNNGADLELVLDSSGSIEKVLVKNSGIGYKERPIFAIETETGYNAELLPVLCIRRIGDELQDEVDQVSPNSILSVVDCVGRV